MSEKIGYVKLHRKSLDSSVFQNANTWYVWSWCLMKANHETHKFPWNGGDMEVVAGQFITGIEKATKELHGISKQSFRTILTYLKNSGRVDLKSTNKFTLVTVLNWPKYQNDNKQLTNKQQTTNKQLTTYKNDNNDKNDKEVILHSEQSSQVNELMGIFYKINPGLNFGNKTQRGAMEWMIEKWGLEKARNTVEFACTVQGQQYAPTITSPLQLKNKIGDLTTFFKKQNSNSNNIRSL